MKFLTMNSYKTPQYLGYLLLAVGAGLVIYTFADGEVSQLFGLAGVTCIMFGVFKITKRTDYLEEENAKEQKDDEDRR